MVVSKRKNLRQIYREVASARWEFFGQSKPGTPFEIGGMNVWAHDWVSRKNHPRAFVRSPRDEEIIDVGIYHLEAGSKKIRFAAGSISESVFAFYFPPRKRANQALEPTSLLVTPRANARVAPIRAAAHL
jgi:hypothetical protein